ncbi:MAG TPA: CPBP family intramembrane glutamic endopeptidase [Rhizomicrobium sp.]|nr:CPBP family intramembrane glutamic endopeptidase [Rhizomicrobium sp.]
MLDRRAKRIVWTFLIGVIASEGMAIAFSFRAKGNWAAALVHYTVTPPGTPLAWALAAAVTLAYAAFSAAGSPVIRAHMLRPSTWQPYAAMVGVAVPMALISGFFEEAFFRKVMMDIAMRDGASIALQIALSALGFGAVHAIWGLLGGNWRGAMAAMLATGGLGAALAFVYVVGGRSLAPCVAAHIAINLLIEPWLLITAATNGWSRRTAILA